MKINDPTEVLRMSGHLAAEARREPDPEVAAAKRAAAAVLVGALVRLLSGETP